MTTDTGRTKPHMTGVAKTGGWEVWDYRECVGHDSSYEAAVRGCLNDTGRLLTIIDPIGRIAALYRDGREI